MNQVDQYTFESLHNLVIWWEEAENNLKTPKHHRSGVMNQQDLIPDSKNELLKMYNKLFGIFLKRKLPLSSREIDDFDQVGRVKSASFLLIISFNLTGVRQVARFLPFRFASRDRTI